MANVLVGATPGLQVEVIHAVEDAESLVDGVAMKLRCFVAHDVHQPSCHVGVELVVARKGIESGTGKELGQLKGGCTGLHAQGLGFVAARHDAPVVVAQHNHGLAIEVGAERPLATHIAVVDIYQSIVSHRCHRLIVGLQN